MTYTLLQLLLSQHHMLRLRFISMACWCVGAVFSGVSLLLWVTLPVAQLRTPWALVLIPALPIIAALGCHLRLRYMPNTKDDNTEDAPGMSRHQIRLDLVKAAITPIAQSNPWELVAGAFCVGGLVVLSRPWRWGIASTVLSTLIQNRLGAPAHRRHER